MVGLLCFGYKPGSSVLYYLESGKKVVGNAVELVASIVDAKRNVSMNHTFCCFPIEKILNFLIQWIWK